MKKKVFLLIIGALAIAFAGFAVTVSALENAQTVSRSEAEAPAYTVRAENGKVTVYSGNPDAPEIETAIDTSNLREYDKQLLEKGIEVDGYEKMLSLLEDFSN